MLFVCFAKPLLELPLKFYSSNKILVFCDMFPPCSSFYRYEKSIFFVHAIIPCLNKPNLVEYYQSHFFYDLYGLFVRNVYIRSDKD